MADTKKTMADTPKQEPKTLKQHTLAEIAEKAAPKLVEISGFYDEGDSVTVRLRRPSLLQLAVDGSIPNELMGTVNKLYKEGLTGNLDLAKQGEVLLCVAKAVLAEPTYEELQAQGITLTERQLTELYVFLMNGVRALKDFRENI